MMSKSPSLYLSISWLILCFFFSISLLSRSLYMYLSRSLYMYLVRPISLSPYPSNSICPFGFRPSLPFHLALTSSNTTEAYRFDLCKLHWNTFNTFIFETNMFICHTIQSYKLITWHLHLSYDTVLLLFCIDQHKICIIHRLLQWVDGWSVYVHNLLQKRISTYVLNKFQYWAFSFSSCILLPVLFDIHLYYIVSY